MPNENNKSVSDMAMGIINHLNKRPLLSLLIFFTIVADVIWLNYVNFFDSGLWTYFEYRPIEAGGIVCVAIAVIVVLIKKIDK